MCVSVASDTGFSMDWKPKPELSAAASFFGQGAVLVVSLENGHINERSQNWPLVEAAFLYFLIRVGCYGQVSPYFKFFSQFRVQVRAKIEPVLTGAEQDAGLIEGAAADGVAHAVFAAREGKNYVAAPARCGTARSASRYRTAAAGLPGSRNRTGWWEY